MPGTTTRLEQYVSLRDCFANEGISYADVQTSVRALPCNCLSVPGSLGIALHNT